MNQEFDRQHHTEKNSTIARLLSIIMEAKSRLELLHSNLGIDVNEYLSIFDKLLILVEQTQLKNRNAQVDFLLVVDKLHHDLLLYPELAHTTDVLFFYAKGYQELRANQLFEVLNDDDLRHFNLLVGEYVGVPDQEESSIRSHLLNTLFENGSKRFFRHLNREGISEEMIRDRFQHPLFTYLLERMLKSPASFSFEIALICSYRNEMAPSQYLRERLNLVTTDVDWKFHRSWTNWYLCDASEENALKSIDEKGFVLITGPNEEPCILVKFPGKFSGLVLRGFTTKSGQLIPEGLWISPVDEKTRNSLREKTFDKSIAKIPLQSLEGGQWAFMRGFHLPNLEKSTYWDPETQPSLLVHLRSILQRTPYWHKNHKGKRYTRHERQEYRDGLKEDMDQ